jgi:hypothetical protein
MLITARDSVYKRFTPAGETQDIRPIHTPHRIGVMLDNHSQDIVQSSEPTPRVHVPVLPSTLGRPLHPSNHATLYTVHPGAGYLPTVQIEQATSV